MEKIKELCLEEKEGRIQCDLRGFWRPRRRRGRRVEPRTLTTMTFQCKPSSSSSSSSDNQSINKPKIKINEKEKMDYDLRWFTSSLMKTIHTQQLEIRGKKDSRDLYPQCISH